MNLKELAHIVSDIKTDPKTLSKYSRDASIFDVRPKVVVRPGSSKEIESLVKFVSHSKKDDPEISITPRAAGTCMSGGSLNESIILDVANLDRIIEFGDDYAIVEPGVYYRNFEKETYKRNLLFPSYPASKDLCAFGGIISNNAGGEKSLRYGKTEKYVQEIWAVLADGKEHHFKNLTQGELDQKMKTGGFEGVVYRKMNELISSHPGLIKSGRPNVSKNSSGYNIWNVSQNGHFNLANIFVGAQGTLGIITKAKIKLVKPRYYSSLMVVFLKDLANLGEIVRHIASYNPEGFESYDDKTLKLAIKFFPKILAKMGGNAFKLAFSFLPEWGMILRGGFPKLVLIIEFTSETQGGADAQANLAAEDLRQSFGIQARISKSENESSKYWTIRRESFNLLRKNSGKMKAAPFIDDIIVRPEHLPDFLPDLGDILDQYKKYMIYTLAGHAGDGNFHIIPLINLSKPKSREIIFEVAEKVYDLVARYKGSISAEHNDGIIRTPYLSKIYSPEMMNIFKQVKDIFDPHNIFNPGKKVGGSLQYAKDHVLKV